MTSPFGSRGADRSATPSAGTDTPLLRLLKLQQPNHQSALEYDVSCLSLTHMSGWWNQGQAYGGKCTAWLRSTERMRDIQASLTRSADEVGVEQVPTASPSRSPSAMLAGDVQNNDSLPSLEELLRSRQNRDIHQVPHQNHKPISKRQLDEDNLLTGATTLNSVYVPGNTQREPLIIEDDSDDESDDEAEVGVASSDILATKTRARTAWPLKIPHRPPAAYLAHPLLEIRFGIPQCRCSELAETDQIHQGVEEAIIDEMRLSPLRERACGSIEATSGEDKGPISYCQQIKDIPQHQRVEDEAIVDAPFLQVREHSVKPYQKDNEDNDNEDSEDDEDEDVRPPIRQKRRRRESDTTESATRKKAHIRSFTTSQAQTCTTRGSTAPRSSPDDAEPFLGADYQEYPRQGFLKCVRIGRDTTYNLEFRLLDLPDTFRPSIGLHISNSTSSGESVGGSANSQVCASHAKRPQPAIPKQRKRPPLRERIVSRPYSAADDDLLIRLKEDDKLPWDEIAKSFPGRTKGTLQVRYSTKLKNCSQTSNFEMMWKEGHLEAVDALPSTSSLAATADFTTGPHRDIISTRNKEHTTLQLRCGSQGVESDTDEIYDVEALLAKLTVRNVVRYLVKWEGFGNDQNTWQEQDDISSDLVDNFEASYQGNFGVEILKKRERRGEIEYFVKWNGRPTSENSWEKEDTIHSERIKEFEAR
ncbi:hypothetical protein V491_00550 [Pseudogymnoascus sp. VKM F-3775]|nr:hypothetical protein V491_00550 [Pseudogymnoascus sp. VKM F-3775]